MFNNMKSLVLAFIAITLMFGCKGPPRPGYHRPYTPPHRTVPDPVQKADEKAQKASQRAIEKLERE